MNYKEQLFDERWLLKREEIIERDKFKCYKCGLNRPALRDFDREHFFKTYQELKNNYVNVKLINDKLYVQNYNWLYECLYDDSHDKTTHFTESFFGKKYNPIKKNYTYVCFSSFPDISKLGFDLQVHHTFYKKGLLAWEYENDSLLTLCSSCHKKEHQEKDIIVYNEINQHIGSAVACSKCKGSGYLPEYHYYQKGICFECKGSGDSYYY